MRVTATLIDPAGAPIAQRRVELLTSDGSRTLVLDVESTDHTGAIEFSCRRPTLPAMGLRIDGRPLIALPHPVPGNAVELGTLLFSNTALMPSNTFPCEGQCFGGPTSFFSQSAAPESPIPESQTSTGRTLTDVVQDTAMQLDAARESVERSSARYTLGQVTITMKGVLGGDGEHTTMMLPGDAESIDAQAMSEVGFTMHPAGPDDYVPSTPEETPPDDGETPPDDGETPPDDGETPPDDGETPPDDGPPVGVTGPNMPDLRGYTRSIAERKLAAMGLSASFDGIAVDPSGDGARHLGRIVTHLPHPNAPLGDTTRVRLFIGRADRSV